MAQTVGEVTNPDPVTLDTNASIVAAAGVMRDCNIGDIVVRDDGRICGVRMSAPADISAAPPNT